MKKIKRQVTILIPAYNEEFNIKNIVTDILSQKGKNFVLKKLCVVSDCSSDQTVNILKRIKNKKLSIIENKKRVGKIGILNSFFSKFRGDVLIQLDADIRLEGEKVIESLVNYINKKAGLVCGIINPSRPKTFVESLAFFGIKVWKRAKKSAKGNTDLYECSGNMRAFSKEFIKKFRLPTSGHISEDAYSFYFAKKNKFKVLVCKNAHSSYRLPATYKDYVIQMRRFLQSNNEMRKTFGVKLVNKYETITTSIKIKALIIEGLKSPIKAFCYVALQIIPKVQAINYKQPRIWETSKSSKILK